MDHAGAVVGPLIATAFLLAWPGHYRALFLLSIVPGALAIWALSRVPEGKPRVSVPTSAPAASTPRLAGGAHALGLPPRLWAVLAIILVFSLGNSADAFLLLRLSTAIGHDAYIPLLWSALHVIKASLSVYGGSLSDRAGRKAVIVAGWGVYALVYIGFAAVESAAGLIALFLAYGVYFGLAEGSEKALVADLAPAGRTGAAFGVYNAALGAGTLLASIVFGVLYERLGHSAAFMAGAALAAVAAVLLLLVRTDKT
jgi:MFS family permease